MPPTPHFPLSTPRVDLFCTVVDNYGDIGVCWRLARQLAGEHGLAVRLWVDDLKSFARLCPDLDPRLERQFLSINASDAAATGIAGGRPSSQRQDPSPLPPLPGGEGHLAPPSPPGGRVGDEGMPREHPVSPAPGVEIRRWGQPFPEDVVPGDVVIEAFACEIPESFAAAMAHQTPPPCWINLEYLSAEDWVEGCHGLPSPGRPPLLKYFFFPGFTTGTGGLLLEDGLLEARQAFQADPAAQSAFWESLGVPGRRTDELRVFLFSYANVAALDLLEAWAASRTPVTCLIPEGTAVATLAAAEFGGTAASGSVIRRGALSVHILPFLEQPDFDRLLWACDLNFVRGEDSFVRAQWAARPFVWHIYPQDEDTHHLKLAAFLERYCADLPPAAAAAQRALWHAWNGIGSGGIAPAWEGFREQLPALDTAAPAWAGHLAGHGDLASHLENFVNNRL